MCLFFFFFFGQGAYLDRMDGIGRSLWKVKWPPVIQKHFWEREVYNSVKEKRGSFTQGQRTTWVTSGQLLGSIFAQLCEMLFVHFTREGKAMKWLSVASDSTNEPILDTPFLSLPWHSLPTLSPTHTLSSLPYLWYFRLNSKCWAIRVLFSSCSSDDTHPF